MDLKKLLREKEEALSFAKGQVALLEKQIATLRDAESMWSQTDVEKFLHHKGVQVQYVHTPGHGIASLSSPAATVASTGGERQRNPRGSLKTTILGVLTELDQDLNQIEAAVNAQMFKPISRPSLRTQLMYLKNDGLVASNEPGVFRLAEKGESPTTENSEAFNLKPSPNGAPK